MQFVLPPEILPFIEATLGHPVTMQAGDRESFAALTEADIAELRSLRQAKLAAIAYVRFRVAGASLRDACDFFEYVVVEERSRAEALERLAG